jgi:AcrR family transcriptional regulator
VRVRRPKDRKQQILAAASVRFHAVGYHSVSMADIAGAVGITAGALYRHFRDKQDLLDAVVGDSFARLRAAGESEGDLDALVETLAEATMRGRELGVLWEREARHLPAANQRHLRRQFREVNARLAEAITARRPDLADTDADLIGWAVLSMLGSPAHHTVEIDLASLVAMADALCRVELPVFDGSTRPASRPLGLSPVSRREALLAAAVRLFGEHGYQSVSMADIGAATDIAGPSVYNHFASKTDILLTVLNRGVASLWLGLHQALAEATSAEHALALLVDIYICFALRQRELVGALVTEVGNLPEEQRHRLRNAQREFITEWTALLRIQRAGLSDREAHLRVRAAMILVNDLVRTPHLAARTTLAADLSALALALLAA